MVFNMIKQEISELIGKENIILTKRGNESIKIALQIAKEQGKTQCFILDQGGWITYPQFIKKLNLNQITIKTDNCKINLKELKEQLDNKSTLLIHSLSGYWYKQPMKEIYQICKEKQATLICDVAGSIFDKNLIQGDIIIGSFGRWKPIDNHSGGFISTDKDLSDYLEINNPTQLLTKIKEIKNRTEILNSTSLRIIETIKTKKLTVLNNPENNPDMNYVVIAPFETEEQKEILLKIAKEYDIEANLCPREIRTLTKAVSFEVKKL